MSNLQKGDLVEVKPDVKQEDVTETRPTIAQFDVISTDVPDVIANV